MATLTSCMKKAGKALRDEDRADILARFNTLIEGGAKPGNAAQQAVGEQIAKVRVLLGMPPDAVAAPTTMTYPLAPAGTRYEETDKPIAMMSPDAYLAAVRPLEIDEASRDNIDELKRHIQSGKALDPLHIRADGKEDGRHRAVAAKELGIKQVPVVDERSSAPETQGKPTESGVQNFGEALPPSRRTRAAALRDDLTDDDIHSKPLSEIWPAAEIDAIEDVFAASVAHAARAEIPSKPRKGYKLDRWAESVKMLRGLAQFITGGKYTREQFIAKVPKTYAMQGFMSKVALLEAIDRANWKRIGAVSESPQAFKYVDGKQVPTPMVSIVIDDKHRWMEGSGSVADHIDAVNSLLGVEQQDKKMQFEVRGSGNSYAINKKGDSEYRKLKTFTTAAEASAYRRENYADLIAAWEAVKERDNVTERDTRSDANKDRVGKDWRQGRDITGEEFDAAFGFRGGEFGKWVSQGDGARERQWMLNRAFDALMDLSEIIGVPPKAISLNGTMGIAFGSRGTGRASAHFEPGNLVINLTKTNGAGALAHEWFHALDNYFARARGGEVPMSVVKTADGYRRANFITYKPEPMMVRKDGAAWGALTKGKLEAYRKANPTAPRYAESEWIPDPKHPAGVRPEVEERFSDLVTALNEAPMTKRASMIDKGKSEGYWSQIIERAARSFESYVIHRLHEKGQSNEYLANVTKFQDFARDKGRYPYPTPDEIKPVADAFSALFDTIQTRADDAGNVAMFNTNDGGYTAPDGTAFDLDTSADGARNIGLLDRGVGRGADQVHPYVGRILRADAPLADIAAAFGGRVQWFDLRDDLEPQARRTFGFFNGAQLGGTIYLRASGNDRPHLSVLGHETAHRLRRESPGLYARLVDAITPYVDVATYEADFSKLPVARGVATPEGIQEEFIGEVLSDGFMDPQFWQAVGRANPSLLQRLASVVFDLIDTIKAKVGYAKRTERYLTDYDRVMQISGEVMADFGVKPSATTSPFSRSTNRLGIPLPDAQAVAAKIRLALPKAPPIIVHESIDKAPAALLEDIRAAGAMNDVEAAYHAGAIHVFPQHMASVERMEFVVAHHEVRHHGLRSILGDKFGATMLAMRNSNPALKAAAQRKMDDGLATSTVQSVDEALADMPVEELAKLSGFDKLVAAIRQWLRMTAFRLRKAGFGTVADAINPKGWTDRDVAAFVLKAEMVSRDGGPDVSAPGTVFGRAADGFSKWFGDSKVVDAQGKPLVVYHGSSADISTFKSRAGLQRESGDGRFGNEGIYFAEDPGKADAYAGRGQVYPVYLSIKNPLMVATGQAFNADSLAARIAKRLAPKLYARETSSQALRDTMGDSGAYISETDKAELRRLGFDGIYSEADRVWIALDANQIKSAIGNNGDFDGSNPDIRYSRAEGWTIQSAAKAFTRMVNQAEDDLAGVLFNWNESELKDGSIVNYPGRDSYKTMGNAEGGKLTSPKRDFMAWLMSDAPFDAKVYGPDIASNEEWVGQVSRLRALAEDRPATAFSRATPDATPRDEAGSPRTAQDFVKTSGGVFDFNRMGETKQDRVRAVVDKARPFWLGALTRDQIADMYGKEIPQIKDYDDLTRAMENERSSMAQKAETVYEEWAALPSELNDRLARMMLDATVFQVHPDKASPPAKATEEQVSAHARLHNAWRMMPKEGQAMYFKVRDFHTATLTSLKTALEGRIDRLMANGAEKSAALTDIRARFDQYLKNGPYFPLTRFGDFLVIANRDDGERVVAAYESAGEQQAAARALQADGFSVKLKTAKTYKRSQDGSAGKFIGDVLTAIDKMDLAESGSSPAATKEQLLDDLNQLFIRALPDLSYRKHFMHRKNTPGFSADVMRGFASSAFYSASHIARLNHSDKMTFALDEAFKTVESAPEGDFNQATQVLNEMASRHEAMLNPTAHPLSTLATQAGFVMYLGLSPAAGLINMLQVPMVALPYLGARYGFTKATMAMSKAYKDIMGAAPNRKSGFNAAQSPKLTTEERQAMSTLQDEGVIDLTQAHDLAAATDRDVGSQARSKASFAIARAMKIVGWTFHVPEVMNRQVTALMTYRMEIAKGATVEVAMDAARDAIKRTQFDYSSSNRARYMQGNLARVVTQFMQFSQNMTYFLGRAAYQALKGEDPEVRSIARRQILSTFAVTGAMAGSLGLPGIGFFGSLIGALAGAMGDDDEPWDWKTEYRNMLADTFGKEAGEVLAKGVPRALMPWWDISNRVSLSDLWWRSNDREGQNPRESFASDMGNILGPTAGTILGWYTAADHMQRGNYSKAAESVVPKFIRDPLKALREGTEGVTNYNGEPLLDTTAAEDIGRMFGFAPTRASEMYEARNAVMNSKTALEEKRQRLLSRIVKARMDGDRETEDELRSDIAGFNERNPAFKITGTSIGKAVMNKRRNRENTEDGILLPASKDSLRDLGRFAVIE